MTSAIGSVIIASAQSVAKIFVVGVIGYLAVLYPRTAPLLPRNLVGTVARFTFHTLTIPLIYSTIAIAVTIESVGNYWFVMVGAFVVLGISYLIPTLTFWCFRTPTNSPDFCALRVAATYPNIVALPIFIFPCLCEFPVVYEGYIQEKGEDGDASNLQRQCVAQSSTMVFCYFFSWSLAFWTFGNPQLMQAASKRHKEAGTIIISNNNNNSNNDDTERPKESEETVTICNVGAFHKMDPNDDEGIKQATVELEETTALPESGDTTHDSKVASGAGTDNFNGESGSDGRNEPASNDAESPVLEGREENRMELIQTFCKAVRQTISSPGFIAMVAAFVTACIPPLQKALFEGGGGLRFLGSALETLGMASSPISTMVVAASLVPPRETVEEESLNDMHHDVNEDGGRNHSTILDENPGMTDPNFGPYQRWKRRSSSLHHMGRSLRSGSIRILKAVPRSQPDMLRLHVWFCLSRLILAPAVVVGLIVALDCSGSGLLTGVPNLAKLVIIINAALPGALIVIVLLKAHEDMTETAAAVAKVYLPSYLLSIVTTASWTAIGLWITIPDSEGKTFCQS